DQLELEEDPRIDTRPPQTSGVAVLHQIAHEVEVEDAVEVAVEVVGQHQVVQRHTRERGEEPRFRTHHGMPPFNSQRLLRPTAAYQRHPQRATGPTWWGAGGRMDDAIMMAPQVARQRGGAAARADPGCPVHRSRSHTSEEHMMDSGSSRSSRHEVEVPS